MSKSVIPVEHGFANPSLSRAAYLVSSAAEFREMAIKIQRLARGMQAGGKVDFQSLMAQCSDSGIKEQMRSLFLKYKAVPDTPPVLGCPPPTDQLYGRFNSGVAITDIGSGNCMKLKKFSGVLKLSAIDPCLTVPDSLVLTPLKIRFQEFVIVDPEIVFSSFMSACQLTLPEQEVLFRHDGLHLLPDHELLIATKVAEPRDGRVIVRTPKGDYKDYSVPKGGHEVEPGYRLLPTFKNRTVEVVLAADEVEQEYKPIIDARPAAFSELDLGDMGHKWDGVPWELELSEGSAYMVNRAGVQRIGDTDYKYHMCVHVEELTKCYVLLRVVAYKGFVPPHCGYTLRVFAESVLITINGKPVCGPPIWKPGGVPRIWWGGGGQQYFVEKTDGVISRSGERDLYCKHQWTFDLRDDKIEKLTSRLEKLGMILKSDLNPGLWEYGVKRIGHEVHLEPIRPRTDKKKETTMETVEFLLKRPTLDELDALI